MQATSGKVAFFEGTTYVPFPDPNTIVRAPSLPAYSRPNQLFLNRTTDVFAGTKRTDAEMVENAIHEGTHAVDEWDVERPRRTTSPSSAPIGTRAASARPTFRSRRRARASSRRTIDLTMPPPGPKSPRAREIFNHVFNSYPAPARGVRQEPGRVPRDGGQLHASRRAQPPTSRPASTRCTCKIRTYAPGTFPALHTTVKGFFGIGVAPPTGVLSADEQAEIQRERSWGLLIGRVVTNPAHRTALAATLKLP